ncbi:zinc ribbon domain-containing protein [Streptomyces sp. SID13726]|uniref:NADase-type glycan-binding domain-containing protein n=1 Tax=Streptomyces sp. SID13726 TaxID=2706058 RepID=UPI0013BD5CBA|nr:zinc ribbon domain-containing protein [Streptomyces sp. SID13726]NEB05170.1 zinc ribbon domain-containing protein [Streptomyces sp. SID13726]
MTITHNCADCGTRAEPGQSFCDACGAVLSWTDRERAGTPDGGGTSTGGGADSAVRGGGHTSHAGHTGAAGRRDGAAGAGFGGEPAATAGDFTPPPVRSAAPSSPEPAAASGAASPGWNAFAGSDGNAGLTRARRDLLGAPTATAPAHPAPRATDDTAPTEPVPTPAGPTGPTGLSDPSVASVPSAPSAPEAPTIPAPAVHPAAAPASTSASDGMTDRARQLLVPVADPEARPAAMPSVAPVLPGRPAPQRPQTVRAPGEEPGADGGTPCPWCATRNRPDRHFCTRCAMPMAGETQAPGRLPWWRRLLGSGNRETPWAGDRPRLRRTFDRVLSWLGVAVVLTLLTVLAFNIPQGIQATKDHFAKRAGVDPTSWSASRSYPGHKASLVGDKYNNTWWGPGVAEVGAGQWIQAKFDEPTRLLDLMITPGVSKRADQISQSARPRRLEATITLADGSTTTRRITLDPGAGSQRIPFRVGTVSAVRFTIETATGTSSTKQVAIAEIEFFGPSSANSS